MIDEIQKDIAYSTEDGEMQESSSEIASPITDGGSDSSFSSTEASDSTTESDSEETEAKEKKAPKKKKTALVVPQRELTDTQKTYPWYVVHTYSGFEMRVKITLEERMKQYKLDEYFGDISVPQETVVELVKGQKKETSRKTFPGYILIQVDLNDDTWHLVNETPKVTGFVGNSRNPIPITKSEVLALTNQQQAGILKAKPKINFETGDAVKVVDGPFAEFNGTVDEVKADKGKLRVLISIFGRNTPVELDFVQVEKV
jgi:transcription termination/antitermination protein NusG